MPLYAGPEEQEKLAKIAPGLDLTIDYGWLTVIAVPLFWVLAWLNQWVGNWGVAIILLTVIIKLLFYPLSAASYRSMAKMRVLAPKLQRLKDQYGDDRQRLQQAMMELYKTEKINPLGGCMPIVVQIPVFIALYWVLLASVELRHAPFVLWIDDLAAADPWFILPILMARTMFIQTWLNPEPPDPVQAQGHEDHADRVQRVLLLLPGWPGAVLAGQQRALDRAAVADHARAGARGRAAQAADVPLDALAPARIRFTAGR